MRASECMSGLQAAVYTGSSAFEICTSVHSNPTACQGYEGMCMQAPVPYLNRALAEEQLGVDADQQNCHQCAQQQYQGAVQVHSTSSPSCSSSFPS